MTTRSRLETAFLVAAAELGMASAAWLFVREVARDGEDEVQALRDGLGRAFPVLDAVARQWLSGSREPLRAVDAVTSICAGASRIVVAGLEATYLDELVRRVDAPVGLVRHAIFEVDWTRVLSNYGGAVAGLELHQFQAWAGSRSVLLAFAYGTRAHVTHVSPSSLRVLGPDVLTQFRNVVAWDVLEEPMHVYPRWLADVPLDQFSDVV